MASLEGGRAALAAASGHAAQFLVFQTLMEPGDEFLASRNLYGGSLTQFGLSFKKLGWTCHFVDPHDPDNFRAALTPRCKAIFVESLANPGGMIVDLEAIAKVAHEAGIPLIVDNTLATPYLCRPIERGADIVTHSTTKFLDGHGNSLGGIIVESGKFDWAQGREVPVADGTGTRLSRAAILREFRRLRLHHQGARGGLARLRPDHGADERVPDHHRHRDIARADGTPLRQRPRGGRTPGDASRRRVGVLRRAGEQPLPRARAALPAARRRGGVHLRRQGRLRGGGEAGRNRCGSFPTSPISATPAA